MSKIFPMTRDSQTKRQRIARKLAPSGGERSTVPWSGFRQITASGRTVPILARTAKSVLLIALLLAVTTVFLLLANAGRPSESCPIQLSIGTIGCLLREYKELAAGLLGASGAIFAAWIAWLAVQRQLLQSEELATARERAAIEAAKAILREDFLETFNAIWRAIDLALEPADQERKNQRRATAESVLGFLPKSSALAPLEELLSSVGPMQKRKLALVLASIRWVYQQAERSPGADEFDSPKGNSFRLLGIRTMFSHVHKYLQGFDPHLAAIFDRRTKSPVDHTPTAAMIDRMLDEWEAKPVFTSAKPRTAAE